MYTQSFMPHDVLSGAIPRPTELPDGLYTDVYVATPDGDVFWPDVAPAWIELGLIVDNVCQVAMRNREPTRPLCLRVYRVVAELRELLGEPGAAVCDGSRIIVFNIDGTRAAIQTVEATIHDLEPNDDAWTIQQAAEYLGVSNQAIVARLDRGTLTAYIDPDAPSRQGRRRVSRLEITDNNSTQEDNDE